MPVGIECKLGLDGEVTTLVIGEERLISSAAPLDRSPNAFRRLRNQRKLRKECVARTEIAPNLVCGDAHGGGGDPKNPGKLPLLPHDAAAPCVQPIAAGNTIVCGDRRAAP